MAHSRITLPGRRRYVACTGNNPTASKKAIATPWGPASLVEQVSVSQRAGEKRFSSSVQLLESRSGERLVRFAYSTDGTARRGPVTLRARDLERLRKALADHPELAAAWGV